ncbi:hypothetical protein [Pseudalkalibacillus sp. SCS-8]|uniref:hypothetical protein n=1 Tax=Pseudalkalibacillus nanhaiensis TaxID=3115291 RepID=UPI0032DBA9BE
MVNDTDRSIIEKCKECRDQCSDWLEKNQIDPDSHTIDDCTMLILECYDICSYTVTALSRESQFAKELCQLGELICEACGNECNKQESPCTVELAETCYEVAERFRNRLF